MLLCLGKTPKHHPSLPFHLSSFATFAYDSYKQDMQKAPRIRMHMFPIHPHIITVSMLNMLLQQKYSIVSLPSLPTSHVDITYHLERFRSWFKNKQLSRDFSWPNTWNNLNCEWSFTSLMFVWAILLQHLLLSCCYHGFSLRHILKTTAQKSDRVY